MTYRNLLSLLPLALLAPIGTDAISAAASDQPAIEWIRQFGTNKRDVSFAVHAGDDGGVYVGGQTEGPLVSSNMFSAGFLAKYSQSGDQLWVRQLDSSGSDAVRGIATDSSGDIFVAGTTGGDLGGGLGISTDAFLRKYDSNGSLLWTRQLDSGAADEGAGVAVDEFGDVYVSGVTIGAFEAGSAGGSDYFVAKFASNGNVLWKRQHGTSGGDGSLSVTTDKVGGVYVSGQTNGALGGPNLGSSDMFVSKFDYNGNRLWTGQLGTPATDANQSVSADSLGNVFVAGYTESGSIGSYDGILGKYDPDGNFGWMTQLGTPQLDWIFGVSADGRGNAYVAGTTEGDIEGSGDIVQASDVFVSKYDSAGDLLWTKQIVTPLSFEFTRGSSTDGKGGVYVAGETFGNFGGTSSGNDDAFLLKLFDASVVPEPTTVLPLVLGAILVSGGTRRRERHVCDERTIT